MGLGIQSARYGEPAEQVALGAQEGEPGKSESTYRNHLGEPSKPTNFLYLYISAAFPSI